MKKPSYNDLVFINCPFDNEYLPLLRAIVYAIYRCGFYPTSAFAQDNGLENRIDKIFRIVEQCRYGVHDISRVELNVNRLPRFNMPFELGIFFGAGRYGNTRQRRKNAIVLECIRFQYQQYLSDISGIDIKAHSGDPYKTIREIRNWLATISKRRTIPHSPTVIRDFEEFVTQLPKITAKFQYTSPDDLSFNDYCQIVEETIKQTI